MSPRSFHCAHCCDNHAGYSTWKCEYNGYEQRTKSHVAPDGPLRSNFVQTYECKRSEHWPQEVSSAAQHNCENQLRREQPMELVRRDLARQLSI